MREQLRIPPQNVVDGDHVLRDGKDAIVFRFLVGCAVSSEREGVPLWRSVKNATGYASEKASQLCRAYGFNPEYSG